MSVSPSGHLRGKHVIVEVSSTAITAAVFDFRPDGIEVVGKARNFFRLGQVVETGGLDEAAHASFAAALKRVVSTAAEVAGERRVLAAFGSEAARRLKALGDGSQVELVKRSVERITGVEFEILDERQEPELVHFARVASYPYSGRSLVLDLGGHSADFALAHGDRLLSCRSLRIGGDLLLQQIHRHELRKDEIDMRVGQEIVDLDDVILHGQPDLLLITGGLARRVALAAHLFVTELAGQRFAQGQDSVIRFAFDRIVKERMIDQLPNNGLAVDPSHFRVMETALINASPATARVLFADRADQAVVVASVLSHLEEALHLGRPGRIGEVVTLAHGPLVGKASLLAGPGARLIQAQQTHARIPTLEMAVAREGFGTGS